MRLRLLLLPVLLLAGACSPNPASPARLCVGGTARIDGISYGLSGPASADRVGAEYARTARQRGCEDVVEFGEPLPAEWEDGDSSFPPNTPLYVSPDHPVSEVLIAPRGDGTWIELHRLSVD